MAQHSDQNQSSRRRTVTPNTLLEHEHGLVIDEDGTHLNVAIDRFKFHTVTHLFSINHLEP